MFINELNLYVDYLKKEIEKSSKSFSEKQHKYLNTFKNNLQSGVDYYKVFIPKLKNETQDYLNNLKQDIQQIQSELANVIIPSV